MNGQAVIHKVLRQQFEMLTAWIPEQRRPRGVPDGAKLFLNIFGALQVMDVPNENCLIPPVSIAARSSSARPLSLYIPRVNRYHPG
jgi:hypothetical protein